jgi:hypothetical protein
MVVPGQMLKQVASRDVVGADETAVFHMARRRGVYRTVIGGKAFAAGGRTLGVDGPHPRTARP